jgi:hypothetical protein
MDKNTFLIDLSERYSTALGGVAFTEQPELQQVFSAIWELESEVNNGGFDQYFRNSDSDVIAYAPTALRAISASACAGIVERAIKLIAPLPPTQEGRYRVLDAQGESGQEQLTALDAEFFAYPDNLTDLLFEHVRRHPEVFGAVPNS